jgi:uncharacterized membrane protein YfcA
MTPPLGGRRKAQFLCGIVMILLALVVFHRARVAEESHQVVPSYRYATWMSPTQAYVAAAASFIAGVVIIAIGVSAARREREQRK